MPASGWVAWDKVKNDTSMVPRSPGWVVDSKVVMRKKMAAKLKTGTEAGLKRRVMSMLAAEYPGAVVRKRHGSIYSTAGDPDLYILFAGVHIECELKQPGKGPTPIQVRRLLEWQRAGAVITVIRTVDEMRALMYGLKPPTVGL